MKIGQQSLQKKNGTVPMTPNMNGNHLFARGENGANLPKRKTYRKPYVPAIQPAVAGDQGRTLAPGVHDSYHQNQAVRPRLTKPRTTIPHRGTIQTEHDLEVVDHNHLLDSSPEKVGLNRWQTMYS